MTERNTKKTWWIVLGCMICIIIGLIISIFVVKNLNQKPDEDKTAQTLITQAQNEINAMGEVDIPKGIEIYQKYLDMATSDEEKVELYNARVDFIMAYDNENTYSEQVINDLVEADNISQSFSSALRVVNILYYYREYGELLEKYTFISNQRAEASGADMNALEATE